MRMQTKSCIMVMKKRYVNALLLGMSLCVAAPGTAVSASEIPAQESAVEDTSDAELEAIMREAEAAAAGADGTEESGSDGSATEETKYAAKLNEVVETLEQKVSAGGSAMSKEDVSILKSFFESISPEDNFATVSDFLSFVLSSYSDQGIDGDDSHVIKPSLDKVKEITGAFVSVYGETDVIAGVKGYVQDKLGDLSLSDEEIKKISQIYIVACGSAYHVGMAAQYVIEDLTRIPVRVELASEFRYRNPILDPEGLVVIVSQSGETADSLAALREAKQRGIRTLGIVNVVGSSIAREADNIFYTLAGPEISVATTKAYSTQLIASYALAVQFGKVREQITEEKYQELIAELKTLPDKIAKIIEDDKERIQWFAAKQANARDAFFIGRGIDYAISMEGSLKMKEVSYVHTEAYAAGELKHGTISLIEDGTLVIGILTQNHLYEKTVSNMVECKSRGAYLMGLTTYGHYNIEDTADFTVYIPKTDPHFATSLAVIPLQLLGYYVSVAKGLDVDKPRNLAKSVTVE